MLGARVEMAVSVKSYFGGKIETQPLSERKGSMRISAQVFSLGDRESHLYPCQRGDGKT